MWVHTRLSKKSPASKKKRTRGRGALVMGSGTSKRPLEVDVSSLSAPRRQADCLLVAAFPHPDSELKTVRLCVHMILLLPSAGPPCSQKGDVLLLEVGNIGFRLLRSGTEDPINLWPWGQIHSWAHGPNKFTFRYFDEG